MDKKQKFEELQLAVPWGHISAKAWGSQSEKRILAAHGLMDNAGTFDRIIHLLPKDYYIVCVDLPGHGFSSHFDPGVPLNYFSYVLSIHYILSSLQWNTCTYIGHSFGGQIGAMFSILYPQRFDKLILLDTMITIPVFTSELISRIRNMYDITMKANADTTLRLYSKDEALHAIAYKRYSALNSEAAEALFERAVTKVNDLYKYNRDFRLSAQVSPFFNFKQLLKLIQDLSTPCLIIAANSTLENYVDHLIPNVLKDLKIAHNFITVAYVHGNHDVHNNYPERVAPHICKFLNGNVKSKL